jgi:hypothetical protein
VDPADAQLIEEIRRVTQSGSRLLVTLARRGKALERDEPQRAAFLLAAVGTHPLYKGGRLTFDMLEIEDLMLDGSPVDSMSTREVIQLLNAGAHHLAGMVRQLGSPAQGARMPAKAPTPETDVLGGPVAARAQSADALAAATPLPRVSLGPADDVTRIANASGARDEGRDIRDSEPVLQSSDYLYDYVVLGLLDMVGGMQI